MRRKPGQRQRPSLAGAEVELAHGGQSFAVDLYVAAEAEGIRPGRHCERVIALPHPWCDTACVESDDQVDRHRHRPGDAFDDSYDVRPLVADGHEVDEAHHTAVSF